MDQKARIGLFGGTFDPVHIGHVAVAVEARFRLQLDEVWLVVAHDPWQKSSRGPVTPADQRLDMVTAAVAGHPGLGVSDIEVRRGGASYTIDTVEALVAQADITLIMGADTAAGLETWHRADELAQLADIAVVARPGATVPVGGRWRATAFESPSLDVSSTDIRRRCAVGEPVDHLVPAGALNVIATHGLYGFRR